MIDVRDAYKRNHPLKSAYVEMLSVKNKCFNRRF